MRYHIEYDVKLPAPNTEEYYRLVEALYASSAAPNDPGDLPEALCVFLIEESQGGNYTDMVELIDSYVNTDELTLPPAPPELNIVKPLVQAPCYSLHGDARTRTPHYHA